MQCNYLFVLIHYWIHAMKERRIVYTLYHKHKSYASDIVEAGSCFTMSQNVLIAQIAESYIHPFYMY